MTIHHLNKRNYNWKHIVDFETLWILTFSAAVSVVPSLRCFRFPRTILTHSHDMNS
jgi:hypothetical protein